MADRDNERSVHTSDAEGHAGPADASTTASSPGPAPEPPAGKKAFYADPKKPPTFAEPVWDAIPARLRAARRWVLWRSEWKPGKDGAGGKWDKPPYQVNGRWGADSTNPAHWTDFETARAAYQRGGFAGIGYVLEEGAGEVGVDLDDAIDPATGELLPWAAKIVATMPTYCEVSPSGTGVKLYGIGAWDGEACGSRPKHEGKEIEIYPNGRYFAVTGNTMGGFPDVADIQAGLDRLAVAVLKAKAAEAAGKRKQATTETGAAEPLNIDDEELIRRASAANDDGKFRRLWAGDKSGFKSDSEAVGALVFKLAFWTQKDAARMDRLFRASGLMSAKWDEKRGSTTWGAKEIASAIENVGDVYDPSRETGGTKATMGDAWKGGNAGGTPGPAASDRRTASGVGQRRAVPEYIPFPVECLPERVLPFVFAVSEATNTDPAFAALPLMAVLGAAVGTSRAVMPKAGWRIFPSIYAANIGRSASGKSPAQALVNEAIHPIVDELNEENRQAAEEHQEAKARHLSDRSKKGYPPPDPPPAKRFRVGDTTIQALAVILHANPRGVVGLIDELAGWFGSFTRCSNTKESTDRPLWLSLFDSGSLEVDRKTGDQKHLSVRNTMACIAGGIQPRIIKAAMTEENIHSGLFPRILLAYPPDRLTQWSDAEVSDSQIADLTALLRALRAYEPTEVNGQRLPVLNRLTAEARTRFITYFNANRHRAFTADDAEAATTTKLESYALKFAHLRHLCRFAGRDDSAPVSLADVEAGIVLADWFLNEFHRVRALLGEPERLQGQRRLVAWIRRERGGSVTPRDLQRSDGRRYPDTTAARARLEQLAADGFGEWETRKASNNKTVEWFVLHPETPSDARQCPTVSGDDGEGVSDTVSDTANATSTQTHAGQGSSSAVSDTVGRRTGSVPRSSPDAASPPASGAVSDSPTDPLPPEFYRPARPSRHRVTGATVTFGPPPAWQSELMTLLAEFGAEWTSTAEIIARLNDRLPVAVSNFNVVQFLDRKCAGGEVKRDGTNIVCRLWRLPQVAAAEPGDDEQAAAVAHGGKSSPHGHNADPQPAGPQARAKPKKKRTRAEVEGDLGETDNDRIWWPELLHMLDLNGPMTANRLHELSGYPPTGIVDALGHYRQQGFAEVDDEGVYHLRRSRDHGRNVAGSLLVDTGGTPDLPEGHKEGFSQLLCPPPPATTADDLDELRGDVRRRLKALNLTWGTVRDRPEVADEYLPETLDETSTCRELLTVADLLDTLEGKA